MTGQEQSELTGRMKEAVDAIDLALDVMEDNRCHSDDIRVLMCVKDYLVEKEMKIQQQQQQIEHLKRLMKEEGVIDYGR